jgi:hypothetical protein
MRKQPDWGGQVCCPGLWGVLSDGAPLFYSADCKANGGGKLRAARVIPSCRAYGSAVHYPLQSSNFLITTNRGGSMSKRAADSHKKAAEHHEKAAQHHKEASKHHEENQHEKAAHHAHLAHGHGQQATQYGTDAAKSHIEEHGTKK